MGRRWRWAGLIGGLLGLAILLALVGFALQWRDLQTAANLAQLVSVVLALPTLVVGLVVWAKPAPSTTGGGITDEADKLAGVVAAQWKSEVGRRSMQYPMPVRWRLSTRADLTEDPQHLQATGFQDSASAIAELVDKFRALPKQRLVILGGPGSGKTTLAVQLLLRLLEVRQPGGPVPVLMSLTGWDGASDFRVRDWLTARLRQDYSAFDGRALVEAGMILPVLDGLDELPDGISRRVLTHLNASLPQVDRLILTSRIDEYTAAVYAGNDVLASAVVLEPEPLSPATAASYLRTSLRPPPGPKWNEVIARLDGPEPPTALAAVASTPLGLWLLRATAKGQADPGKLLSYPTAPTLAQHLFAGLIPALIRDRPSRPRQPLDPGEVRTWLEGIAGYLAPVNDFRRGFPARIRSKGLRDFQWWDLARLALPRWALPLTMMAAGGLLGTVWGAVAGAMPTPPGVPAPAEPPSVAASTLAFGVVGLLLGSLAAITVNNSRTNLPVYADLRSWRWLRFVGYVVGGGLLGGAGLGFGLGLLNWLIFRVSTELFDVQPYSWIAKDPQDTLSGFVTIGIILGAVGTLFLLGQVGDFTLSDFQPSTPTDSLRAARDAVLVRIIGFVAVGAVLGLPISTEGWTLDFVPYSVVLWSLLAVAVAVFTERSAWFGYLAATAYLALQGKLPFRLMSFLDDMHRLGLLRAIGATYQFRHAEFQDHLTKDHHTEPSHADLPQSSPAAVSSLPPPIGDQAEPEGVKPGITWRVLLMGGLGLGFIGGSVSDLAFGSDRPVNVTNAVLWLAAGLLLVGLALRSYLRSR